jgi:hypothetical protein
VNRVYVSGPIARNPLIMRGCPKIKNTELIRREFAGASKAADNRARGIAYGRFIHHKRVKFVATAHLPFVYNDIDERSLGDGIKCSWRRNWGCLRRTNDLTGYLIMVEARGNSEIFVCEYVKPDISPIYGEYGVCPSGWITSWLVLIFDHTIC